MISLMVALHFPLLRTATTGRLTYTLSGGGERMRASGPLECEVRRPSASHWPPHHHVRYGAAERGASGACSSRDWRDGTPPPGKFWASRARGTVGVCFRR